MAVLILAAMGLATLACYQPPIAMRDEDELEAKINRALGKK
jgi:hypothetical protein